MIKVESLGAKEDALIYCPIVLWLNFIGLCGVVIDLMLD